MKRHIAFSGVVMVAALASCSDPSTAPSGLELDELASDAGPTRTIDLGTLGGSVSFAWEIIDRGIVVGGSERSDGRPLERPAAPLPPGTNAVAVAAANDVLRIQYHHPTGFPSFCSSSHTLSGAKYSTSAFASISRDPVSCASASGQGLDAPSSSIAFSFSPAALLS